MNRDAAAARHWCAAALGAAALFLAWHVLAWPWLGVTLHIDEAQYWTWSRALDWGYYSKPPLIAALLAASTSLFGHSELGVKALPLLLTTLTALALGGWVAAMAGNMQRGGLATLLALASPLLLLLGFAATTDVPLLLTWTLAAWALWSALQKPISVWRWGLLGVAVGLGVLSKYTMLAFGPGALLATILMRPAHISWPQMLRGVLLSLGVATLIVAPHVWWNIQADWPTWRHTTDITLQRSNGGTGRGWLAFALGQMLLIGPLALCIGWSGKTVRAERTQDGNGPQASRFVLGISAPLLLLGLAQAMRGGANVNWAAPALLGGLAWLALRAPLRAGPVMALLGAQALLVVALVHAPGVAAAVGQPWTRTLDFWSRMRGWDVVWRDLWQQLSAGEQPALVIGYSRAVLAHGQYHWRDHGVQWLAWDPARQANHHYAWRSGIDLAGLEVRLRALGDRPAWLIGDDPDAVRLLVSSGMAHTKPTAVARWEDARGHSLTLWAWRLQPARQDAP